MTLLRAPRLDPAVSVWRRDVLAFGRTWRGSIVPTMLDPIFFLIGLGFGLGAYVGGVDGMPYREFVASGLCASAALWAASFEATFGFYWRMEVAGVHENFITTQAEPEDVVLGELLWVSSRAVIYGTIYLSIIAALGFVGSLWAVVIPLFLFLGGLAFGAIAMAFSVYNHELTYFGYYIGLVVNPLFLFGGILYPLDQLPDWARELAWFLPTVHLVDLVRSFSTGQVDLAIAFNSLWLLAFGALFSLIPLSRLRRRLID